MKTSAMAAVAVALCFWACGADSETDSGADAIATVKIESPLEGATVTGPKVPLRVSTTHFTFAGQETGAGKLSAAQRAARSEAEVKGGHIHIFLDKLDTVDAAAIAFLAKYDTATLTLTAGPHTLYAAGADADHDDVESMLDSVHITVAIP